MKRSIYFSDVTYLFLRPIISEYTGPIFSKFSGSVDIGEYDQSDICFAIAQGTLLW